MRKLITFLVLFTLFQGTAFATVINLDARTNLFRASSTGIGGGLLPFSIMFDSNQTTVFDFLSVGGITNCCLPHRILTNADGLGGNPSTNINSSGGISGIVSPGSLFLAGVFTSSQSPASGAAPEILNFYSIGTNFNELSPLLNQSFFIGDGKTGNQSGDIQRFFAPEDADTLHLDFIDGNSFRGNPGAYADNAGSLSITLNMTSTAVPEPNTVFLFIFAIIAVISIRGIRGSEAGYSAMR